MDVGETRTTLRVARVIARLNIGGPATHVATLTSRLPPDEFESRLYVGEVEPGEMEMTHAVRREGVHAVRIAGLGRSVHAARDAQAFAQLVREFREFRPHVVHTHTAKAGALGRAAARLCGVPVVVHTFHGHVFDGYFSRSATAAFIAIERVLARVTDRIVTISPRQHAEITRGYRICRADRACIIPLGFDLTRFERAEAFRGQLRGELGIADVPVIAAVGRLTSIKDHPLLLRALREMADTTVQLCIVGGGEGERALRSLAEQLGVAQRTHFLGFRTDLERILADVDVVALTSRNEGTPVALIEALAAGCTPVSVDVGGVADVLERGRWGILVRERSPQAIAVGLGRALREHRTRNETVVRDARSYVREKYGIERLVHDHIALYRDLMCAKRVNSPRVAAPDR